MQRCLHIVHVHRVPNTYYLVCLMYISQYISPGSQFMYCHCRFAGGFTRSFVFRHPPCWCLLANITSWAESLPLNYNQWQRYSTCALVLHCWLYARLHSTLILCYQLCCKYRFLNKPICRWISTNKRTAHICINKLSIICCDNSLLISDREKFEIVLL